MQRKITHTEDLNPPTDHLPYYDGGTGREIDPPKTLRMEARSFVLALGILHDLRETVQ